MNIDIDRSTDELEARIAAAMHALAETHHPTSPGQTTRSDRRPSRVLSIAAVCLLVVGLGGLVVAIQGDREPGPTGPAPTNDSPSHTVTSPPTSEATSTGGPADAAPLPDGVVPVLRHAPAGYPLDPALPTWDPTSISWVTGVDRSRAFAVVDEKGLVAVVTATDESAPWALASSGLDPVDDLGVDAAVDADPVYEIVVRDGDLTRRFHDPAVDRSAIHEVAAAVGDRPLDAVEQTARVIPLPTQATPSTPISYGAQGEIQLTLLRFDEDLTDQQVDLLRQNITRMLRGQIGEVEQVSRSDLLLITAPSAAALAAISGDVEFLPQGESGVSVPTGRTDIIAAAGGPKWGRWELHTSSTDASCWNFALRSWYPQLTGLAGSGQCGGQAVPREFCYEIGHGTYAGAFLDSTSPVMVDRASGYTVETEQTGRHTSFIVTPTGSPATPPRLTNANRTLDCPESD